MKEEAAAAASVVEEEEAAVSGQAVQERCTKLLVLTAARKLKYPSFPLPTVPYIARNVTRSINQRDSNWYTDFLD